MISAFVALLFFLTISQSSLGALAQSCQKLDRSIATICTNATFNRIRLPNSLGHRDQKSAANASNKYMSVARSGCSHDFGSFICSSFYPPCGEGGRPLSPCYELCDRIRQDCSAELIGFDFSDVLNCSALATFDPANITSCYDPSPHLVINEINADSPGSDKEEFIEIYDGGVGSTSLNGFIVVLFNGALGGDTSYQTIDLGGWQTSSSGYFLIGNSAVSPNITRPSNFLQNGADAVAIYKAPASSFPSGTKPTQVDLVDAVVYSKSGTIDTALVNALLPNQFQIREDDSFHAMDESISRCYGLYPRNSSAFKLAVYSPGGPNHCFDVPTTAPTSAAPTVIPTSGGPKPSVTLCASKVLINEINADSPGSDVLEYIELSDGGVGGTSLDGLILVLYNGNGDRSYLTVSLTGYKTNAKTGLFLLGSTQYNPDIVLPTNSIQNGPDAVALYMASPYDFPSSTPVNSTNLVDVVVYGTNDQTDVGLLDALAPGQMQVNEDWNHHPGEESISRCAAGAPVQLGAFLLSHPTPGMPNNCSSVPSVSQNIVTKRCPVVGRSALVKTSRNVTINEVVPSGPGAFIELYDGGKGDTSLRGLTLVVYSGDSTRYVARWNLDRYQTNASGYFVIGKGLVEKDFSKSLSSFVDITYGAVALYDGPVSSRLRVLNLADAIVFSAKNKSISALALLSVLTPNFPAVAYVAGYSIARVGSLKPFDSPAFVIGIPTPLLANAIPPLLINELNADDPDSDTHEFLELYDGGRGNSPLGGFIVVLFNGRNRNPPDTSYLTIDLAGETTNSNGYFVVGSSQVSPKPDLVYRNNFLQNGADAVAIYRASASSFPVGTAPSRVALIDAIVYSKYDSVDPVLVNALLPNQSQVKEDETFHFDGDESINRCFSQQRLNSSVYRLARPTPGRPNDCNDVPSTPAPKPPIVSCRSRILINEINADSPGLDTNEFIELSDGGIGGTSLDGLVVVLYNGNGDASYLTVPLTGYQTDSITGLFILGSGALKPDIVLPPNSVQNGADAVALHMASPFDYPQGTAASSTNLVDAVVYGTNDQTDVGLVDALAPGQTQVNEDWQHHPGEESISRCAARAPIQLGAFLLSHPTPGMANNCSSMPSVPRNTPRQDCVLVGRSGLIKTNRKVVINEVLPSGVNAFVELYDGGKGDTSLGGMILVMYEGSGSRYVGKWNLAGYKTNSSGYFIIGSDEVEGPASKNALLTNISYGAFALYDGPMSFSNPLVMNLADAVVFETTRTRVSATTLLSVFTPNSAPALYLPGYSLGRLGSVEPFKNDAFKSTFPTPLAENAPLIVINELNADDPDADSHEFLELYDGGIGGTSLDGYLVVLFNGNQDDPPDASYRTIDLAGKKTNARGYFVIGSSRLNPSPDFVYRDGFLQNGPDAVAIYRSSIERFPVNTRPTRENLVDAIVYSARTYVDNFLLNRLLPGQDQLLEDPLFHYDDDESLSRCGDGSLQRLNGALYRLARPTPGEENVCNDVASTPSPPDRLPVPCTSAIVINEINADTPALADDGEFVELYDGGKGATSLDGIVLVLYNGYFDDKSYLTVALTGYRTDSNGYFVIGSASLDPDMVLPAHSIQNGPDGVALYAGSPYDFPQNTQATDENLIDALVYGTNDGTDLSLLSLLTPGESQANEDWNKNSEDDESISRCSCCTQISSASYLLSRPTPRRRNDCPSSPTVARKDTKACPTVARDRLLATNAGVIISEVLPVGPTAFVEIFDGGRGDVSLSNFTVFVFASTSSQYVSMWNLKGYRTDDFGYFLLGVDSPPSGGGEKTRLNISSSSLNVTGGAVALYDSLPDSRLTDAVANNLADAVVFGRGSKIQKLLDILTPGQEPVSYDGALRMSIAREGTEPFVLSAFQEQRSSPGTSNIESEPKGTGLSGGAIAGIIIAVIVVAAVAVLLLLFVLWRKKSSKDVPSVKFVKEGFEDNMYAETDS